MATQEIEEDKFQFDYAAHMRIQSPLSFDLERKASRKEYLIAGLSFMALKYGVDLFVYWMVIGGFWHPLDYLNPIYAQRMAAAPDAMALPPAYPVFLLLWGLLFAWIGTAWSARRATDAGISPWWSLFFLVPLTNYLLILFLLAMPSSKRPPRADPKQPLGSVVLLGLVLVGTCAVLFGIIIQQGGNYGRGSFISLPVFLGAGAGFLQNRRELCSARATASFALVSTLVACGALLLFAVEGVVCIVMALPVVFLGILAGSFLGRAFAKAGGSRGPASLCFVIVLPVSAWLEGQLPTVPERAVVSVIEVDAPPEVVWRNVVSFSELPAPQHWLFDTGIAYPLRARIEGSGVGAVRYCEFSTGAFVEPITVWDEPRRLAFDVAEQPIPMEEWSFYNNLRPPHLTTAFRSVRGEFLLTPLEGGRTRLQGTTWYKLDIAPMVYWQVWSEQIIHSIHGRVLQHVKALSEG